LNSGPLVPQTPPAAKYEIAEFVFDPWRAGQLAQELRERGIHVIEYPQSDSRMCPSSERLRRAIIEKRLTLPTTRR
jgi:phage terminase large subunit-like protein